MLNMNRTRRATIQGQYRSFREFVELIVSEAAHRQSFSLQEGKDRAAMQAMEGKYRNVMNQCWEKRYELEMFCMEGRDDVEKEWSNRMDQLHASLRRGTQVISAWENERHLVEDELLLHYHNLDEEEKKERVNVVFRFKQERKKVEKFMAEKYAQRKTVDADEGKRVIALWRTRLVTVNASTVIGHRTSAASKKCWPSRRSLVRPSWRKAALPRMLCTRRRRRHASRSCRE